MTAALDSSQRAGAPCRVEKGQRPDNLTPQSPRRSRQPPIDWWSIGPDIELGTEWRDPQMRGEPLLQVSRRENVPTGPKDTASPPHSQPPPSSGRLFFFFSLLFPIRPT